MRRDRRFPTRVRVGERDLRGTFDTFRPIHLAAVAVVTVTLVTLAVLLAQSWWVLASAGLLVASVLFADLSAASVLALLVRERLDAGLDE
ncbi:hypothetical protein ACFQPA_07965 [Halomarina halobia]|uniref:hypothetical protein n=1 Tax=Halomarina halobia TaxID=3033386 RepID=UPI0023E84300|nr:hypothetical protein [Halomarina sp. PSR21]